AQAVGGGTGDGGDVHVAAVDVVAAVVVPPDRRRAGERQRLVRRIVAAAVGEPHGGAGRRGPDDPGARAAVLDRCVDRHAAARGGDGERVDRPGDRVRVTVAAGP